MPDTELLTDQQIREIARDLESSPLATFPMTTEEARALIATVKQLREQKAQAQEDAADAISKANQKADELQHETQRAFKFKQERDDLQSQLEQLRAENQQLKLIVDVGTNDDPGTALAKLRKIQHVAAASVRDKCVEAIRSLRAIPHGAAYNNAVNDAIRKCESLTLDPLEPEK